MLRGTEMFPVVTLMRLTLHDVEIRRDGDPRPWWIHGCWGPIDPAHVGEKQSQGAYDVGRIVPLCRASHAFYDEHRSEWRRATGYTEASMENLAAGYALKFVERGGTL